MERKTNWKMGTRLLVLLCCVGVGFIVASVIIELLKNQGMLTLLSVQQILAFIIPSIAAMSLFYRRPARAMCLDSSPSWTAISVVVAFYFVSMPAMNWTVSMNESMSLPSWMSGIEQTMRLMEDTAAATTKQILDIHSISQLIVTLLVVGFLAGLSEETLFRGAMLRTMQDSRWNVHVVVWTVGILFSAMHMQFYGFIPRMLLGVWLGYLLVWTRSLWVPIIAHTLNNSTVVVMAFLANKGVVGPNFGDNFGLPQDGEFPWAVIVSFVLCLAIAVWCHHHFMRHRDLSYE